MEYVSIAPAHDTAMEQIVKNALKAHGLDIPGTAYFDASLKSLSAYYNRPGRCYYVLLDGDEVLGGIGIGISRAIRLLRTSEAVPVRIRKRARAWL